VTRHDWTVSEIRAIHDLPLPQLMLRAQTVHQQHHQPEEVQLCSLLSVKTGGCPEDCAYCPQSSRHDTEVNVERMMSKDEVLDAAGRARAAGATRFCMGAAWREVKDGPAFDNVLAMVRGVREMGMEACVTLGMLNEQQARKLADAGLSAYNHNLDTSKEFYGSIITTRTFEDRLTTLRNVRKAGITVCSGDIIGMGESIGDRCGMLMTLANLDPHPESVPINVLVRVEGTPLAEADRLDPLVLVRTIATARILLPQSRVRLSAGRRSLSQEAVTLCFLAGANSIFVGDRLLTTPNPERSEDAQLLAELDLIPTGASHGLPR
jgi:biotin synthase